MTLIEEKTLADHDINVRSIRQELLLLEEQLKKHGRNEPQPSPSVTADPDTVSMQSETTTEIQKILDYLDNELHPLVSPDNWNVYSELYDMVSELENLPPSPTPSRPHGHWIKTTISEKAVMYECPLCNRVVVDRINNDPSKTYPFCHCGADMRGEGI